MEKVNNAEVNNVKKVKERLEFLIGTGLPGHEGICEQIFFGALWGLAMGVVAVAFSVAVNIISGKNMSHLFSSIVVFLSPAQRVFWMWVCITGIVSPILGMVEFPKMKNSIFGTLWGFGTFAVFLLSWLAILLYIDIYLIRLVVNLWG